MRIRRTHATGGSNSTADGGTAGDDDDDVGLAITAPLVELDDTAETAGGALVAAEAVARDDEDDNGALARLDADVACFFSLEVDAVDTSVAAGELIVWKI